MQAPGRLTYIIATLAFGLTACASPAAPGSTPGQAAAPPAPKKVVAAVMSSPPFLSTKLQTALIEGLDNVQELLTVGLSTTDQHSGLRPRLAEAVPSIENGLWKLLPDGKMETTWKIRPDAVWHDGTPFTSADVAFSATVDMDRELAFTRDIVYGFVEKVEAPDPSTVTVTWKQPYIKADSLFGGFIAPAHILEKTYREEKTKLPALTYWTEEFVGTGPYRLKEFVGGSHAVLQAFDRYPQGRPKIDELTVKFIPDGNTLFANILAGEVDLTIGKALTLEQAQEVMQRWNTGKMEVTPANAISIYPQLLNPQPAVVGDLRFRRALMYAVDRQEMADTILGGVTSVVHSYLSPGEPQEYQAAANRVVRYEYDPRKAVQMIEEIGYTRRPDGGFVDTTGQRLTVEMRTTVNDIQEKAMYAAADYWQRSGVAVEPLVIPRALAQDREYRATYPAFEEVRNPNNFDSLARVHGSQAPRPENNFTGNNRTRYMNPEFDSLIDRFHVTIPMAERVRLVGDIVNHMTDRVLVLGLFYDAEPIVMSKRLTNVTAVPVSSKHTWNANEWDLVS
jgi:peptide/nickel transport system substrate-binding protein